MFVERGTPLSTVGGEVGLGPAVWALAVAAPVATFVTRESGKQLQRVIIEKHYSATVLDQVAKHAAYSTWMSAFTLGLSAATILMLFFIGTARGASASEEWA